MLIKNLLFDLDGTLTDPKEGITASIQYALEKMGRPVPPAEDLIWCIGPPLLKSFDRMLSAGAKQAKQALAFYRERYNERGKLENRLYPEIPALLEKLNKDGVSLFVATAKPHFFARQISDHFDLSQYFKEIYGAELNGIRSEKTELIAYILEKEGLVPEKTLMVGDRRQDVVGAARNGLKSIGVTYGYGDREELTTAGADYIVDAPAEILSLVRRLKRTHQHDSLPEGR